MNNRTRKKLPKRLCWAASEGRVGELKRMLEKGANPGSRFEGVSALYLAAARGEIRCAALLLGAGASPNEESRGWRSGLPLAAAATHADADMVRLLLDHGADPLLKETGGASALEWAQGWDENVEAHREVEEMLEAASRSGPIVKD
ncbi:ankyrin repeat domain-containing protein (plasmid) [Streptomyces sp. CA-294286]|uniref:ankyrin repeat domain-containing protein n=1 Tax=Streptomyces sp. CA-294286 TaxID=3240070 RepID=UPI003D90B168